MSEVAAAWRPVQEIRVKALGLIWRDDALLAAEVYNDAGVLKGVRPLGGSVEFGENWRDTVVREIAEELAITVRVSGEFVVMENLYLHEGARGHEIIFAADVTLCDATEAALLEANEEVMFREDNGVLCRARWVQMQDVRDGRIALFPEGLLEALSER